MPLQHATLQAYHFVKSRRDGKRPIAPSALNKMMEKFEVTGCLASRLKRGHPSPTDAVATTVKQTVQSMSAISAHGNAVLEKFRGRQECRTEVPGEHCE